MLRHLSIASAMTSLPRLARRRLPSRASLALVVAFVLAVALTLPGCLRLGRPGVTIVLWDGPRWPDETGNRYHWVQSKIEEFEASHPFVEVVLVPVEWEDLRGMLDEAKNAGQLPDVAPFDISAGGVTLEEVREGLLEPVESFISAPDDLSPQARAAYTVDGTLWGFPATMTGHVLLLNLDLFAERGVEPPPGGRWTWEEFLSACRALTFDRDGDGETDVWGFATYVLPGYYEVWPFLYAAGARPLSEDLQAYTFDSEAAVAALERLADLIFEEEAAHPSTGTASVGTIFDLFADAERQEVAIEPWSAWAIDYLMTQDGVIKNFGVAAYPFPPGASSAGPSGEAATQPVTVGATAGFVVFRQEDPHRRGVAMELADYLTSTSSQYELARGYHAFPARRSALDLDPFAGEPAYERAAEIVFHAESLPPHPRWPEIERLIQRQIQMALLGIKKASEALQDAGEAVAPLLEDSEP
ncbi:MAG TPA: ABC transporter substrate-binding protein [Clostridiales bacterium]|nr:ABC transporter substrate-binding protein [Clostridiales bacterium]